MLHRKVCPHPASLDFVWFLSFDRRMLEDWCFRFQSGNPLADRVPQDICLWRALRSIGAFRNRTLA